MKKFFIIPAVFAAVCTAGAVGCAKHTDYSDYISEKRYDVYLYGGDDTEIKLYCSDKESPYVADGIKGNVNGLVEIYAKLSGDCEKVTISSKSFQGGEMSYLTVRDCWYISFSGNSFDGNEITVSLDCDGKATEYKLLSVVTDGLISCEQALECVKEHAGTLFDELTENGIFNGEIFIRLLYDEKCYYYVGICDREGTINAFLVDGQSGRIIAEREHRM
jgi:lipoprotein